MVESTGLENRRTRKGTVSSNLTLSARSIDTCTPARWLGGSRRQRVWFSWTTIVRWDGWPSGLRRTPGKCVYVKAYRGFESHPVRDNPEQNEKGWRVFSSPFDIAGCIGHRFVSNCSAGKCVLRWNLSRKSAGFSRSVQRFSFLDVVRARLLRLPYDLLLPRFLPSV